MSRRGRCWESEHCPDAAMGRFFPSLKTERVDRKGCLARDEARADMFDYIARFYNPRRRHSVLGYLSPVQFAEDAVAL